MGRDTTVVPVLRRNSSGDKLATAPPGTRTNAAYGGRRAVTARQNASSGSPAKSASARWQILAWKISPCQMYFTACLTAALCPAAAGRSRKSPHE